MRPVLAQQLPQQPKRRSAYRLSIHGVIEHHGRIAVGTFQRDLCPRLELVAGFFGLRQYRYLHERLGRVEQPEAFAGVVLDNNAAEGTAAILSMREAAGGAEIVSDDGRFFFFAF